MADEFLWKTLFKFNLLVKLATPRRSSTVIRKINAFLNLCIRTYDLSNDNKCWYPPSYCGNCSITLAKFYLLLVWTFSKSFCVLGIQINYYFPLLVLLFFLKYWLLAKYSFIQLTRSTYFNTECASRIYRYFYWIYFLKNLLAISANFLFTVVKFMYLRLQNVKWSIQVLHYSYTHTYIYNSERIL